MIRDLIVQTPYRPGERLPPEREIAERLNVTRTVVREALIMLEIKGLVEVRRAPGSTCSTARIITRWKALTSITVMMPGRLNCYRRVSCWKAISLNLPLCRHPRRHH